MKNIDTINKEISKSKKLPLETVTKINDFYWNTVKNSLRSLDYEYIHIKELGTFEVSKNKLANIIIYLRDYIKNIRHSKKFNDATKEAILLEYKDRYRRCVAMRKIVDDNLNFLNTYKNDEHK